MRTFLIVILLLLTMITVHSLTESPHDFSKEECSLCHLDLDKDPKVMAAPISLLCKKCHIDISGVTSHPSDVYPVAASIPPDFPLKNRMITCNTCHDIHSERFNNIGKKTYFLRRPIKGKEFCLICHTVSRKEHSSVIVRAHIPKKYLVTNPSKPIDLVSLECIRCHLGIYRKDSKSVKAELSAGVWIHKSGNHPIGVDYEDIRRKGITRLRPANMLNEKIRLFNGKVGCGSCHDPYSSIRWKLSMDNTNNELCLQCHDLKI